MQGKEDYEKFKISCLHYFIYTQTQNAKEKVSSLKSLDLVVIQNSATKEHNGHTLKVCQFQKRAY